MMIDLTQIGLTLKPHGKDGQLRVHVEDPFLEDFASARAVFIDLNGSPVPFLVEHIEFKNHILVKLEELDSPEEAQPMTQCGLYLEKEELSEASLNHETESEWAWLVGYRVFQQEGIYVGSICSVSEGDFQTLVEIENDQSRFLWPYHPDFIIELNKEMKSLKIELLEGFTEL